MEGFWLVCETLRFIKSGEFGPQTLGVKSIFSILSLLQECLQSNATTGRQGRRLGHLYPGKEIEKLKHPNPEYLTGNFKKKNVFVENAAIIFTGFGSRDTPALKPKIREFLGHKVKIFNEILYFGPHFRVIKSQFFSDPVPLSRDSGHKVMCNPPRIRSIFIVQS